MDEYVLANALNSGKIGGTAGDVFDDRQIEVINGWLILKIKNF